MRTLLLIIFLFPISLFAQKAEKIPKNSTGILIKNNLSALENHRMVVKTILSEGLYPETRDSAMYYVKTQPKDLKHSMGQYYMNIISKDNQIVITGRAKPSYTIKLSSAIEPSNDYEDIVYRGFSGSYFRICFDAMNDFAKKIDGEISYKAN